MAQNQERNVDRYAPKPQDPATRARHISEAKIHLDRIYFSDTFVELLREGLEDGTGLARYIVEHQRLCFNDEKWRSLFQSALRRKFELQEPEEGMFESPAADKEAFNSVLQKVWEDYFPKEARDNLESRKPDSEVFGSVLLAGWPKVPAASVTQLVLDGPLIETFLDMLRKKKAQTELVYSVYEPKFTKTIRELIDDPLFAKRTDDLSPEDIAKLVRRNAFRTIQDCHFNFAEYDVGGPAFYAVKFEIGEEWRRMISFQGRLGTLLSDVMMDSTLWCMNDEERRALNARLWCKAFENATFRAQREATKQKSIE
ncbi:hypothetical protein N7481_010641 [Penicillium waksmanii]|uniref:uncharacterized protein n=1 Tax=Penicillium waksmanii TaxID=69791 RepID=UPI0025485907|nr:uncharacterized protein N7481_010641 [Penicillium waksmanii]KAJ5973431.1 hypothetical protein N7481_010641 [Penicillium waksmanii]